MNDRRRSFLKTTAIAGIGLGTCHELVHAIQDTAVKNRQQGETASEESGPGDRRPFAMV